MAKWYRGCGHTPSVNDWQQMSYDEAVDAGLYLAGHPDEGLLEPASDVAMAAALCRLLHEVGDVLSCGYSAPPWLAMLLLAASEVWEAQTG